MVVALCGWLACTALAPAAAQFTGLGNDAGWNSSGAVGVSADSSVVVGAYNTGDDDNPSSGAFLWTSSGGRTLIPDTFGVNNGSPAAGISADGTAVVGTLPGFQAYVWTQAGGVTPIPNTLGGNFSTGMAISGNGTIVSGQAYVGGPQSKAMYWSQSGGMTGLTNIFGGTSAWVTAMTPDASLMVGTAFTTGNTNSRAYHWTQADGMVGLGLPAGASGDWATGVSDDGVDIVGFYTNPVFDGYHAYRWSEAAGFTELAKPADAESATAGLIAPDGSIVFGTGISEGGDGTGIFWDSSGQLYNLQDYLVNNLGLDLTGWTGIEARDIVGSNGNYTLVGGGIHNDVGEGFILTSFTVVPEPSAWGAIGGLVVLVATLASRRRSLIKLIK